MLTRALFASCLLLTACGIDSLEPGAPAADPSTKAAVVALSDYDVIDLGTLGGSYSEARAINEAGVIAGISETSNGELHVFLRALDGEMRDLGFFPGARNLTYPVAVTQAGFIMGVYFLGGEDSEPGRVFLWTPGQGYQDLLSGAYANPIAMNTQGQIVGFRNFVEGGLEHAFLWRPGKGLLDLGTLGGDMSGAAGINDRGEVAAWSLDATGAQVATLWTKRTGMQLLGAPGVQSSATGINNDGIVVGQYYTEGGTVRGFRWAPGAPAVDLELLDGGTILQPVAIGDGGHIIGTGDADGAFRAFVHYRGAFELLPLLAGSSSANVLAVNRCGRAVGYQESAAGPNHAVLWTRSCR